MGSPLPHTCPCKLACRVFILGIPAEQRASAEAIKTEARLCPSQRPPGSALLGSTTSPCKRQNQEFHGCTNASLTLDQAQDLRSFQIRLQPTAACVTRGKPPPRTLSCNVPLSPSQMRCSGLRATLVTEDRRWGWCQRSSLTIGGDGVNSGSSG